ncbi:amino acid adenylation domain-containing protein [Motilibacter sp. K478]|nr:amino acid adenylation domain-containing protein [Motilibacter aurantiacus]
MPGPRDVDADRRLPLTGAQRGVWFAQALDPSNPVFNTGEYLELRGPLEPAALVEAARRAVSEADALHVRLVEDSSGVPWQHPVPVAPGDMPVVDLAGEPDPRLAAEELMRQDLWRPLDLSHDVLFANVLFRLGADHWLWYHRFHHVVIDYFGMSLLSRRTAELYTALVAQEPPPPARFRPLRDLVAEDRAYEQSERHAADRAYWLAELDDRPAQVSLATGSAPTSHRFSRSVAELPPGLLDRLQAAAARMGTVWPHLVAAAAGLLVSRVTGSPDVVLGWPVMGRLGSVAMQVPAMVVNVPPLRLLVDDAEPLSALVARVGDQARAAARHGRYRYEELGRDLGAAPGGARLFGPQVNVMPFEPDLRFAGLPAVAHNLSAGPVDDLTVNVYLRGKHEGLQIEVDANPALYSPDAVEAHQRRLVHLLDAIADAGAQARVGELDALPAAERDLVLRDWNDTAQPVPATTLPRLFADQAARTPDAVALVADGGGTLTYAELDERAAALAARLRARGAGPGRVVAVALDRSVELVASLYAAHRAGAAYLPLDPAHPADRLAFVLEDAHPVCVVCDASSAARLPAGTPVVLVDEAPEVAPAPATGPQAGPDDPAYVIYTSGSTGRPKGVVVPHRGIVNRLLWMQDAYRLGPDDRVVQKTPSGFDVSVWEFFWPLLAGSTLVLARPGAHRDPAYLAELFVRERITTAHFVPSMLEAFLDEPAAAGAARSLRRVVCSGEALAEATARRFHATLPGVALHNLYGPTEASVDVTAWECRPDAPAGPVPIGRPVWNTRTYVLDAAGRPAPIGAAGELHLAGVQVADGYLNRPELTAERFLPDPFVPGERMYRTGDLARWRFDGALDYVGRNDDQVKIRGQRIELGEVESVLRAHAGVATGAVVAREDRPGDRYLAAYVVPARALEVSELREHLTAALPDAMVPTAYVLLDALPVTVNGKLDRAALPQPQRDVRGADAVPRTPMQEAFCGLFADVLGLDRVGPEDGFFELGGHSLLAAQLAARARSVLGRDVPLASVFAAPTPAGLAELVEEGRAGDALAGLLPLRSGGSAPALFCLHPAGGLGWCYVGLLQEIPQDRPVYAVQAQGLDGTATLPASLQEMAADYVRRIRAAQPAGPYHLLGWSVGGVIAHEVAVQLQQAGEQVGLVALLDAYPSEQWASLPPPDESDALTALLLMAGVDPTAAPLPQPLRRDEVIAHLRAQGSAVGGLDAGTLAAVVGVVANNAALMRSHRHGTLEGDAFFVAATTPVDRPLFAVPDGSLDRSGWGAHLTGELDVMEVACTHPELVRPDVLRTIGAAVADRLTQDPKLSVPRSDRP